MAGRETELNPYRITATDRAVGVLILVTVALLAVFLFLHSQDIGPVDTGLHYHTTLKRSYGIVRGSDITLSGLPVGKIRGIGLTPAGVVRIDFTIDTAYSEFVTTGSYLQVGSSLGIASLIGGASLQFIPNTESREPIALESEIETRESTELLEAFSELELKKMAANVKIVLQNLKEVSGVIHSNQNLISTSLQNINALTGHMRESMEMVPKVAAKAEVGFSEWGAAGKTIRSLVDDTQADVRAITRHTREASGEMHATLTELRALIGHLNGLSGAMEASVQRLPEVIGDSHQLVRSANVLTERLQHHWLFGGAPAAENPPVLPLSLPDLEYEARPETP